MEETASLEATIGEKVNDGKKKQAHERTEPLSGYALFVKEEKLKVGKSKLNMTLVNLKWKSLTEIQKD